MHNTLNEGKEQSFSQNVKKKKKKKKQRSQNNKD